MGSYLPRLSVFFIRFFKVRVFCTKFSFEGTVCGQPLTVALIFCPQKFYDGYIVADIGDCTDTEIVIPDVYNGKPVIGIDNEAFNGCKEITSVFIRYYRRGSIWSVRKWKDIEKSASRKLGAYFNFTVHCTDGDLTKAES